MKSLLLSNLLFLSFVVHSQSLICDSNIVLKRGIYRSFEEFRNNNPSLDTNSFTVDTLNKGYGFLNLNRHTSYRLVLNNPKAFTRKDSIWGFCDGDKVYYNLAQVYGKKNIQEELIYLGRYCMFDLIERRQIVTPIATGGYGSSSYNVLVTMAININNGLVFELNKKNLKKVLSVDDFMLDEFSDENQKNKVVKEYLIEFSESHRDKIKR